MTGRKEGALKRRIQMIRYYKNLILTLSEIREKPTLLIHALTGCSLRCYQCFNYEELICSPNEYYYVIDDILKYIKRQEDLFDFIVFSGGEYLNAPIDDLKDDLNKIRSVTNKPIIVYTNGTNYEKMVLLSKLNLVDGYHIDMKLPYHLLTKDDEELVELTLGKKINDLNFFQNILKSIEHVVKSDKGYSQVRSVRYPFMSQSAFEENEIYIQKLNEIYEKEVPFYLNDFLYEE
jgi:pyruvate-formate lyase-activating enzyme